MKCYYSCMIEGSKENWNWPVNFELDGPVIAINQYDEREDLTDRVLLTKIQFNELVKFINRNKKRKKK